MTNRTSERLSDRKNSVILGGEMSSDGFGNGQPQAAQAALIKALETENEKLHKALALYQRERDRFKHAKPEMNGAYFLSGGYGDVDDNLLPQFIQIVPAYGCAWVQVYEKTDKTISYEGS